MKLKAGWLRFLGKHVIPASFRDQIFDRFARADSSDKRRNQSGTGLGLSLVRELVFAMEGDIAVESEQGQGTTVRVRLPLAGT
ncbi:ATP-binding protein [Halospina sp. K52047b]|uniref:ATP-binding protein n=1 Tax=Halospina sp. K52047b TaxID=2614160 RepID=UPI001CE3E803